MFTRLISSFIDLIAPEPPSEASANNLKVITPDEARKITASNQDEIEYHADWYIEKVINPKIKSAAKEGLDNTGISDSFYPPTPEQEREQIKRSGFVCSLALLSSEERERVVIKLRKMGYKVAWEGSLGFGCYVIRW